MQGTPRKVLIAYCHFPPIAQDLKRALVRQGCDVEIFYTTDYEHWFYRRVVRTINRYARVLRLVPRGTDLFKAHPLNQVNYVTSNFARVYARYQPDAVLVIHGLTFGESVITGISVPRIAWHIEPRDDLPDLLPHLLQNVRGFDIYNSFSQRDVDLLRGAGFDGRYLCHAADPASFFPEADARPDIDVTFVGNWSRWRDEVVKAALEITPNVAVYGGYWRKKSSIPWKTLRRIYRGKEILGAELNHLYNSSRIVLNASRVPKVSGLNMRFFEVLAAGSVLLTDWAPELERHFVPGKHVVLYEDCGELKQRLQELLADSEARDRIRQAGLRLVVERHNYDLLAAHLLSQFREIAAREDRAAPADR